MKTTKEPEKTTANLKTKEPSHTSNRKIRKPIVGAELEKVIKMEAADFTLREIGEELGADTSTISKVLTRYHVNHERVNDYTKHRLSIIRGIQERLLTWFTDDDIKKMNPTQRVMSYGILFDKEQALLGNGGAGKPVINIIIGDPTTKVEVTESRVDRSIDVTPE